MNLPDVNLERVLLLGTMVFVLVVGLVSKESVTDKAQRSAPLIAIASFAVGLLVTWLHQTTPLEDLILLRKIRLGSGLFAISYVFVALWLLAPVARWFRRD